MDTYMQWFGPAPFGPVCEDTNHADTPVGTPCAWCDETIAQGEHGLFIPHVTSTGSAETLEVSAVYLPYHQECMLRTVLGSLAHVERRCTCYGGTKNDEAHGALTKRQEARLVVAIWEQRPQLT